MNEDNDIFHMLTRLHELHGMDFIKQLKSITECNEFSPLGKDPQILLWEEKIVRTIHHC